MALPIPLHEHLNTWYERRLNELEVAENLPLLVEPKIDGTTVSLLYEAGKLVCAVTRGDGKRADEITRQVRQAGAVPVELVRVRGTLEARGELHWPTTAWTAWNERLVATGEKPLVNPRSGCAGLMKRDESVIGRLSPHTAKLIVTRRYAARKRLLYAWARGHNVSSHKPLAFTQLTRLGALYWDADGFCIWMKRLEAGTFRRLDDASADHVEVDAGQLAMLLAGIDAKGVTRRKRYKDLSQAAARNVASRSRL